MSTQMVPMYSPEWPPVTSDNTSAPARYVCFGAFSLDLKKEELYKDGTRIRLQGKVYKALLALLQKPGEIVTREELRMQLWPSDTHVNYDANVNTTVNKLRQVLDDSSEKSLFVETVPRKGYSFVGKITYGSQPPVTVAPRTAELPVAEAGAEMAKSEPRFFEKLLLSRWFAAGVVTLVIASMLFGAALMPTRPKLFV